MNELSQPIIEMEYYTNEEKLLFMIKRYYEGSSLRNIREDFAGLYPERQIPSVSIIHRTIQHLLAL